MKNLFLTLSAAALCFGAFSAPVRAETQIGDVTLSANVGLFTDYVYRGVSQSDEGPAIQGGIDVSHSSGLYAGIWASNVDFNDGGEATIETDLYAGYTGELGGLTYDLGLLYYAYPGAANSLDYDFWEASIALGYDFDLFALSGSVNYSPDFFGTADDAIYYAAAVDVPLPYDLSFSAHAGYQDLDSGIDYTDWSLGLGYSLFDLDWSLAYYDTDLDEPAECADGCSSRIVFGVSKSF